MPLLLKKLPSAIIVTGFIAGLLDGTAAVVNFMVNTGKDPAIVFKYIASAVFGKKAFTTPGWSMIAWGIFFHFAVAFIFTISFFFLYSQIIWIGKNKFLAGILYGLLVWVIMNQLIVPMSQASQPPFVLKNALVSMLILICFIGIPISLMTNKHYLYKKL
ncbi:hypothetical protein CAP36_01960 [Chitinophagaceae bacterium IBVUCB2]|nr:hypothetical protein CAP36_01960 [Chitinophagaceae bacterium IBVUCB2]